MRVFEDTDDGRKVLKEFPSELTTSFEIDCRSIRGLVSEQLDRPLSK